MWAAPDAAEGRALGAAGFSNPKVSRAVAFRQEAVYGSRMSAPDLNEAASPPLAPGTDAGGSELPEETTEPSKLPNVKDIRNVKVADNPKAKYVQAIVHTAAPENAAQGLHHVADACGVAPWQVYKWVIGAAHVRDQTWKLVVRCGEALGVPGMEGAVAEGGPGTMQQP